MRMLHICPFRDYGRSPNAGGKTRAAWELIRYQIDVGHEIFQLSLTDEPKNEKAPSHFSKVKVLSLKNNGIMYKDMLKDWKYFVKFSMQFSPRQAVFICMNINRKVDKVLTSINPDLIHLHYSDSWFPIAFRRLNLRIPLLTTCYAWHSLELSQNSSYKKYIRYLAQATINLSDLVVLISEHNSVIAESIGLNLPRGFKVVHLPQPEGLRGVMDRNESKEKLGLSGHNVIIYTGLLKGDGRKRLDLLLEAVGINEELRQNYTVVVIGEGKARSDYQKMADDLGIESCFTGLINDRSLMSLYYNAGNVFALPSDAEGWGVVYTEALFCGIPIIGYPYTMSALRQIVGGKICEPFDTQLETTADLAEKLLRLANSKFDREGVSRKIKENFSGEAIFLKYEKIYKELIKNY